MPTAAEDRKIIAAAKLDPDAKPLTKAQLAKMVPLRNVTGLRGRPKLTTKKVLLSVRYSPVTLRNGTILASCAFVSGFASGSSFAAAMILRSSAAVGILIAGRFDLLEVFSIKVGWVATQHQA